jgi:glycosyltransferase involved in cell wall biosynthesis
MHEGPRHLAVFIYGLTGGGAQRRTMTLAGEFAERGHRVDLVVVHPGGPLVRELSPAVRFTVLESRWKRPLRALSRTMNVRGLETLASIPTLAGYLRRERPDVLMSAASHVNLVAVLARQLSRTPVRLVLRTSNDPSGNPKLWPRAERPVRLFLRAVAARIYPRADAIIAVSKGVGDSLAQLTGLPRERITTIYNPVMTEELLEKSQEPVPHPWLAAGGPPVVLGAGKLKIQKDFATLIKAFARVRAVRPARLVILGDGPRRKGLEALVRELGLAADVALPGHVDNPWSWMASASVFALSSAWEGLPGVLIEAMACGCPVVSTDCPSGPAEVLDGGAYGPLVPVGGDQALAEAILAVLEDPPDRARLRDRAASYAVAPAIDRYLEVLLGPEPGKRSEAGPPELPQTGPGAAAASPPPGECGSARPPSIR